MGSSFLKQAWGRMIEFLRRAEVREFLRYCGPALGIALVLRVALSICLPYGYYHYDSSDTLETTEALLKHGELFIHGKKTFLVPMFYSWLFFLGVPVLIVIPLIQHLFGIVLVGLIGLLVRLWFRMWKWWILPITILVAIHPAILWYEHTLLAEFIYSFLVVLVGLLGTLYAMAPSWQRLGWLCGGLFLVSGSRPEGKLFFAFGLALVGLVLWGQWRKLGWSMASLLLLGWCTHLITKTVQAGLLLYTSVCYMTPAELKSAPDFVPLIAPLQAELGKDWREMHIFPKAQKRKEIEEITKEYLRQHPKIRAKYGKEPVEAFCRQLAKETILSNPWESVRLAVLKFRYVNLLATNGDFEQEDLEKQIESITNNRKLMMVIGPRLSGVELGSGELARSFISANYLEERVGWFNRWSGAWHKAWLSARMPDMTSGRPIPGVAYYFLVGMAGVVALALRPDPLRRFHLAWAAMFLGLIFTIALTANVKARFHFVFEPFWPLYLFALLDSGWSFRRRILSQEPASQLATTRSESV